MVRFVSTKRLRRPWSTVHIAHTSYREEAMDLTVFMGRVLALAGAVVLLLAVVMVAYAPLAAAHDTCSSHPSDPDALGSGAANSVVCLKDNHSRFDVCDRHSDGHGVMVRVHRLFGVSTTSTTATAPPPAVATTTLAPSPT